MVSVVIPARNEAARVARLLPELAGLDVTVVANGCTDNTAAVAETAGVRVRELPVASKAAALDAGDSAAQGFPRIYLDADVRVTAADIRALIAAFDAPGVHAATLRRRLDVSGRPLPLRGYFALQSRLPCYQRALFGRGVIAISARGRARFPAFGDVLADDLFLDRLFTAEEKVVADGESVIDTPHRISELIARLTRVRTGTARQGATGSKTAWLHIAAPKPWLWPAACCYAAITIAAEIRRRRTPVTWGHIR